MSNAGDPENGKEETLPEKREKRFSGGIIVSHGIAMGKALVLSSKTPYIPKYSIQRSQIDQELARLNEAIDKTQRDIKNIKAQVDSELVRENLGYLDAHLLILNDPLLHARIKKDIHEQLMNIETIFGNAISALIEQMQGIDNEYLRDRVEDLRDIHKTVLLNLMGQQREDLRQLREDVIIVAHSLSPSETAAMDKKHVMGLITEIGGKTSHSAILARALEIPAIVGINEIRKEIKPGDYVILDANHDLFIINPGEATIKEYTTAKHVFERFLKKLTFLNHLPAQTQDGVRVNLYANIEIPDELDNMAAHGAEGIGLFRSEFIFLDKNRFPDEEEQLRIYAHVLRKSQGKPVVIRTLDVGGDKMSILHQDYHEANPFLGWRSIRFCLTMPDIFKTQLRALYRASVHGQLSIMLPMISGMDELLKAKRMIDQVRNELRADGIPFEENVPVGIMIEVPSAVMVAEELSKHADFFSIGTNDLIQYTIAVDRGNERISYLYKALHPAVLRLIRLTVLAADKTGIRVSMCGEMAGNPLYSVLLVGLGLRHLSMSASFIPEVKKIIRSVSGITAEELAGEVLKMGQTRDIEEYVTAFMRREFPSISDKLIL